MNDNAPVYVVGRYLAAAAGMNPDHVTGAGPSTAELVHRLYKGHDPEVVHVAAAVITKLRQQLREALIAGDITGLRKLVATDGSTWMTANVTEDELGSGHPRSMGGHVAHMILMGQSRTIIAGQRQELEEAARFAFIQRELHPSDDDVEPF